MKFSFLLLALACRTGDKPITDVDPIIEEVDNDGDGYLNDEDCNDEDSSIFPSATEICDGVDNNCDGNIDESVYETFYLDNDNDGFGDEGNTVEACEAPNGYVANGSDCVDTDPDIYPSAAELCDGIDNNCSGEADEGLLNTYFADQDGDGWGDENQEVESCEVSAGLSSQSGDCNDTEALSYPGNTEVCDGVDNDCDGNNDEGLLTQYFQDQDSDGFGSPTNSIEECQAPSGYTEDNTDCNDANTAINPASDEICDFEDNNCDGTIDEPTAIDAQTWFQDGDEDGYGDVNMSTDACSQPSGYVSDSDDCDDNDDDIFPTATEYCNLIDDNCNNFIDENTAIDAQTWFLDDDGDAFGDPNTSQNACLQPNSHVSNNTDCNDANVDINPNQNEICNGADDNCDNFIDENTAVDAQTWFLDDDGDAFGDPNTSQSTCLQPNDYVSDNTDCNDANIDINPNQDEICNGADDNCDNFIDENTAVDAQTWFLDNDGDAFGDPITSQIACLQPNDYVSDNTDCNDTNININPISTEVINNAIDDDCDGFEYCYADEDNDGFRTTDTTLFINSVDLDCTDDGEGLSTDPANDCDDLEASVNVNGVEICDGIDNNCVNGIDEDSAVDAQLWYSDSDLDGYGDSNSSFMSCPTPINASSIAGDCNDNDPTVITCESCSEILSSNPNAADGIYELDPCLTGSPEPYWCDMSTEQGGWTIAGWQDANATSSMGTSDFNTVGDTQWSSDLACISFSEIMVFNDTDNSYFTQSYGLQVWNESSTNFSLGTNGNAFKHGSYGPSNSLIMMGCVNYLYNSNIVDYACDSDSTASAQGHLADYAGEYCSGGRLDYTWAWSNGSSCSYRGQMYTWGYGIR